MLFFQLDEALFYGQSKWQDTCKKVRYTDNSSIALANVKPQLHIYDFGYDSPPFITM